MVNCSECGEETTNPKFCSMSCAAKFNNKLKKKREKELKGKCTKCNSPCQRNRKFCNECYTMRSINGQDITLKEAAYRRGSRCNMNTLVRFRARFYALNVLGLNCCEKCGYNKHIEIAHKKPICEFDENTLISEVNHKDNLMALCPNCHWEFDHPNCSIKPIAHSKSKEIRTNKCADCQELVSRKSKRCRECYLKTERGKLKIDWPPLEILLEKIKTMSWSAIAREIGVTGNAVRKHVEARLRKMDKNKIKQSSARESNPA